MKKTLISIGLIMIVTAFSNVHANFDSSKNYSPNEIELMTRSCDRGYLDDCNTIGFIYFNKDKDLSKAIDSFTRVCNGGHMSGCYLLGRSLANNKEMIKAIESLTKACNGGIMESCMWLGAIYGFGEGVQQDISKADKLMRKACNGGVKHACETLEKRPYDK